MAIHEHTSETTTYRQAGFLYPLPSGLTITGLDTSSGVWIPMTITSGGPPTRTPTVTSSTMIPLIDTQSNLAYGGTAVSEGFSQLAKLAVEGYMDTPTTDSSGAQITSVLINGINTTYAEIVAMYLEGRAATPTWQSIDPTYYRDPYGRVYNSPRIIEFSSTFVPAVPGRTNFSMKLVV